MPISNTGGTIIRFPHERREPLTLTGLLNVLPLKDELQWLADIREIPGPQNPEFLHDKGRVMTRPLMEKIERTKPFMPPQYLLHEVQKRCIAHALKRIARARAFVERAQDREIDDPNRSRIYEDLADSQRALIVAWEKSQVIIGLYRTLDAYDRAYFHTVSACV